MILLGFWTVISSAEAQSGFHLDLDPQRIQWSRLSFHAKNFWVDVSTEIQINALPASELDSILIPAHEGTPVRPQTPQANEIILNTTIKPRFRSPVTILNRIWFDPTNARALGRVRLRRGEDDFKKTYRFTQQGVFRHRLEPKDKREAKLEPENWTDIKDTFYPYDIDQPGCPVISERSLLIITLSAYAMSKDNKPLTICVFGKRQLHRVQIRKDGKHTIKADYIEKTQEREIRKDMTVQAIKMAITTQPIPPDLEDPENFSFLGLHRDIRVYIEPSSGLPIIVSGTIPTVGKVALKLQEVHLKPSSKKTSSAGFPHAVAFH